MSMQIEMRDPRELRPYDRNARTHSRRQIEQLARSIRRFGFTNPVLISDGGEIVAGHGRVEAAKTIGLAEVPTVRLSHLSEIERRAYVLADNKLALEAGWDQDLLAAELGGRRLQLLKDINPKLARVAVLASSTDAFTTPFLSYLEEAAASGGVTLDVAKVSSPDEFEQTFAKFAAGKADAVMIQGVFNSQRARILELAAQHRLATMWFDRPAVQAGGLISLSANTTDIYKRAAVMVDRILKGAKPADLPVEQPAIFELVINLKAARALGLAIPQSVIVQADDLIE